MTYHLDNVALNVCNMWTRMPFRYGIAMLTALPHLFVQATFSVGGQRTQGLAADGLAPKWFTKNPDQTLEHELAQMFAVVRAAAEHAREIDPAETVFAWWQQLYQHQKQWGEQQNLPALLSNWGVSLIERAAIDAHCRARGVCFAEAVRDGSLGIDLGAIHPELDGSQPHDWLPAQPRRRIDVRHTVGLADPLTDEQIAPEDQLADGLPQSLEACIRTYGLRYFKIKVPAEPEIAIDRLHHIATVLGNNCQSFAFTLDGNEFFHDLSGFRQLWDRLRANPVLANWFDQGLLFVEQPLHRDVAMSSQTAHAFADWPDRPPMVIDESDATIQSLPDALACGYAGTSHKNCKGIFKGLANACLLANRRAQQPQAHAILSGEDLANVGPVALLQDFAVAATLGLDHVERNGHHYFAGLSALPLELQRHSLEHHGDLYHWHHHPGDPDVGFASLTIRDGAVRLDSVLDAPFGYQLDIDPTQFTPLEQWRFESLDPASAD